MRVFGRAAAMVLIASMIFSVTAGASISKAKAARQYLADVTPTNSALSKFAKSAGSWTNSTSDATAEKQATPVVKQLHKLQVRLLSQSWPAGTKADVRTLYSAISPLEADLVELSSLNFLNVGTWSNAFSHDLTSLASDVTFVRHDLGLPLSS